MYLQMHRGDEVDCFLVLCLISVLVCGMVMFIHNTYHPVVSTGIFSHMQYALEWQLSVPLHTFWALDTPVSPPDRDALDFHT